jgi:hypothetical protein
MIDYVINKKIQWHWLFSKKFQQRKYISIVNEMKETIYFVKYKIKNEIIIQND